MTKPLNTSDLAASSTSRASSIENLEANRKKALNNVGSRLSFSRQVNPLASKQVATVNISSLLYNVAKNIYYKCALFFHGNRAINYAITSGNQAGLECLLSFNPSLNGDRSSVFTALPVVTAIESSNFAALLLLAKKGACLDISNASGWNLYELPSLANTEKNGSKTAIKTLLEIAHKLAGNESLTPEEKTFLKKHEIADLRFENGECTAQTIALEYNNADNLAVLRSSDRD